MSNTSFWLIDRLQQGATSPAKVDLGAMAIKEYSPFAKVPAQLEFHHQIV